MRAPEASRCCRRVPPSGPSLGCSSPTWGLCSQAGAGIDPSGTGADSHPNLHRDDVSPSAPCSRLRRKTGSPNPHPGPRGRHCHPSGEGGRTWSQITPVGGGRWNTSRPQAVPQCGTWASVAGMSRTHGKVLGTRRGSVHGSRDMETPRGLVGRPPPSGIRYDPVFYDLFVLSPSLPAAPPPKGSWLTCEQGVGAQRAAPVHTSPEGVSALRPAGTLTKKTQPGICSGWARYTPGTASTSPAPRHGGSSSCCWGQPPHAGTLCFRLTNNRSRRQARLGHSAPL